MKICLFGLGNWGKNHARILGSMKAKGIINELYFYDIDRNKAEAFAKRYDAIVPVDPWSLQLDAVDIVVPADLHYEVSAPFIERGIKVFIEKPFTDNKMDALKLIGRCPSPKKQIMVGHLFRFHSGVQLAKKLIDNGTIGEIKKIDIRRVHFAKPRDDNGVIFSLGIHDVDLFCYFMDDKEPDSISCITSKIYGPTEDHAFIKVNYGETVCIAEESWMSPSSGKIRTCSIQGTLGEITFDFSKPSEVHVNSKYIDEQVVDMGNFTHTVPFVEPLTNELEHFIHCVKNNYAFTVDPYIGLRAVQLCASALKSANENKTIHFLKN